MEIFYCNFLIKIVVRKLKNDMIVIYWDDVILIISSWVLGMCLVIK